MSSSRKAFLAGTAVIGMASLLSEAAVATVGGRAVMLTLWAAPKDPDAFDKYYVTTHEPIVKELPGITSYEISRGPITGDVAASSYHMISIIGFDSMSALTSAIESSAGKAMVADLKNFATGTSIILFSLSSV